MWISMSMIVMILLCFVFLQNIGLMELPFFFEKIFIVSMYSSNFNKMFFMLVVFVSVSVFMWGYSYMEIKFSLTLFFVCLMIFVISMLLLILSSSIFTLFLGWEGLGVSSFVLVLFYQNWMSCKGALLTLMTNRIGDSVLLISFVYWTIFMQVEISTTTSLVFVCMVTLVAFTKSAQWPFISWLPAAMAAPTPVSALVHSSTLVTAGVWLLMRFTILNMTSSVIWLYFGASTLMIASMAALSEMDAKKIVALSTLSQLGMMVISLYMGNVFICLFHILMHALAKANLFMVMGNFIHNSFSQQDNRHMIKKFSKFLNISLLISLMSLIGLIFFSGFLSKEQILTGHYSNLNNTLSYVLIILIVGLTMSYCYKLYFSMNYMQLYSHLSSFKMSSWNFFPILILSSMSLFIGWVLSFNINVYYYMPAFYGWYWSIFFLGFFTFSFSTIKGFYLQTFFLDYAFLEKIFLMKKINNKLENFLIELNYLLMSQHFISFLKKSGRILISFSVLLILINLYF